MQYEEALCFEMVDKLLRRGKRVPEGCRKFPGAVQPARDRPCDMLRLHLGRQPRIGMQAATTRHAAGSHQESARHRSKHNATWHDACTRTPFMNASSG